MQQPDFSEFVIHFTKSSPPYESQYASGDTLNVSGLTAAERLTMILDQRCVRSTHMPHTKQKAMCMTECTWPSILMHCQNYSDYGIGFRKSFVFGAGGGPALYIRQDHLRQQFAHGGFAQDVYAMLTPFAPSYTPPTCPLPSGGTPIDYSHEREWRVPGDLAFTDSDIAFIVVSSHSDISTIQTSVTSLPGSIQWVIADAYRQVESLWPQHTVGVVPQTVLAIPMARGRKSQS